MMTGFGPRKTVGLHFAIQSMSFSIVSRFVVDPKDVRSIEDNVKLTCSDLVQNCVVVGNSKPVVLFVEPTPSFADSVQSPAEVKATILQRIEGFQAKRFGHEKIHGPSRIVIVPPGSLPRTEEKGNIRSASRNQSNTIDKLFKRFLPGVKL